MNNSPANFLIRKLDIDLTAGFPRHWHNDDAFKSMYYNALSMSFPVGEQFFIDSVRTGLELLPDTPEHASLRTTIRQFIGQEATHRHIHYLYNGHLEKQGLSNHWQHWARRRIAIAEKYKFHPLSLLAITAAYEHCTAILADGTLRHANWFDGAEPKMKTLWRWHAAEETEHKAVAYDLYQTLGGGYTRRVSWYAYTVLLFILEASSQTLLNLHRDKSLFKAGTYWSALKFLFGRNGNVWRCTLPMLQYFSYRFHPNKHDNRALAEQWLKDNAKLWRDVNA
ncbi:MAG: metal-dependent hydrolase [Pseudomonadota bacterium]